MLLYMVPTNIGEIMIFRQFFESVSSTYTYLIASRKGGEALLIDPVIDRVNLYIRVLSELDLKLVKAIDTHCHADHITALGHLRDKTHCITVMGRNTDVDVVSMRVEDGDTIDIENISLQVLYTPGHTSDSYCFKMKDRIFTGDTLLIRGTGRTDFQLGNPRDAYNSLFKKILTLPDDTLVYPGHDYKGETVSTIGEEKAFNPRLQVSSAEEYAEIMNNLHLPNPKLMNEAVPANLNIGFHDNDPVIAECTLTCDQAQSRIGDDQTLFVDLRENGERLRDGVIPGSVHAPYHSIESAIKSGGLLHAMATQTGKTLLLYCAYGERSALALKAVKKVGIDNSCHISGGIDEWKKSNAPLEF
jgi:glyoxylase-like metal-dependent hydrolase (beta-lactamase superfamily II)/rhodanese-related sulfurtransferase